MKHPPIKIAEQGWEPAVDGKTEDGQGVFDVQGLPFAKESYQGSVTGVQLRERLGGGVGREVCRKPPMRAKERRSLLPPGSPAWSSRRADLREQQFFLCLAFGGIQLTS